MTHKKKEKQLTGRQLSNERHQAPPSGNNNNNNMNQTAGPSATSTPSKATQKAKDTNQNLQSASQDDLFKKGASQPTQEDKNTTNNENDVEMTEEDQLAASLMADAASDPNMEHNTSQKSSEDTTKTQDKQPTAAQLALWRSQALSIPKTKPSSYKNWSYTIFFWPDRNSQTPFSEEDWVRERRDLLNLTDALAADLPKNLSLCCLQTFGILKGDRQEGVVICKNKASHTIFMHILNKLGRGTQEWFTFQKNKGTTTQTTEPTTKMVHSLSGFISHFGRNQDDFEKLLAMNNPGLAKLGFKVRHWKEYTDRSKYDRVKVTLRISESTYDTLKKRPATIRTIKATSTTPEYKQHLLPIQWHNGDFTLQLNQTKETVERTVVTQASQEAFSPADMIKNCFLKTDVENFMSYFDTRVDLQTKTPFDGSLAIIAYSLSAAAKNFVKPKEKKSYADATNTNTETEDADDEDVSNNTDRETQIPANTQPPVNTQDLDNETTDQADNMGGTKPAHTTDNASREEDANAGNALTPPPSLEGTGPAAPSPTNETISIPSSASPASSDEVKIIGEKKGNPDENLGGAKVKEEPTGSWADDTEGLGAAHYENLRWAAAAQAANAEKEAEESYAARRQQLNTPAENDDDCQVVYQSPQITKPGRIIKEEPVSDDEDQSNASTISTLQFLDPRPSTSTRGPAGAKRAHEPTEVADDHTVDEDEICNCRYSRTERKKRAMAGNADAPCQRCGGKVVEPDMDGDQNMSNLTEDEDCAPGKKGGKPKVKK